MRSSVRTGDLLRLKVSFQLYGSLRVSIMLNGRKEFIQFPRAAHCKTEQSIEHADNMVMTDDCGIFGAEFTEAVILLRFGRNKDETRHVTIQSLTIDVDVITTDDPLFFHLTNPLRNSRSCQADMIADIL